VSTLWAADEKCIFHDLTVGLRITSLLSLFDLSDKDYTHQLFIT